MRHSAFTLIINIMQYNIKIFFAKSKKKATFAEIYPAQWGYGYFTL